ncbi:MAG: hypothetical protein RLZZ611_379 [Cyanobacteriota bacterium]|jgi:hypothetical protein
MPRRMATCAIGARAGSYGGRLPSTRAFQKRYKSAPWHPHARSVPSAQTHLDTGMSAVRTGDLQQRLSEQLQALSQVGEALTLRLLELEERLDGLESQLRDLQLGGLEPAEENGPTQALLAATEQRIAQLEALLSDHPRLRVLPAVPERLGSENNLDMTTGSPEEEPELELDPFPQEDEEQPFMDELSA